MELTPKQKSQIIKNQNIMRTLLVKVALCATVLFAPTTAKAQEAEFKELAKIEGVEHTDINKSLLELAAKNGADILSLGENFSISDKSGKILEKIDKFDLYTAEDKKSAEQLKNAVRNILNGKGWEPLIDVNDEDGEKLKIYQYQKGKHTTVAILTEEDDETGLIAITGKINIAKLIEQINKD